MVVAGNMWIYLLYYLCGRLCGLPGVPPEESIGWIVCGILGGITICCIQLIISMLIRSFAIPIGIGLAGGIGGLMITNKGWGLYYPYSLYCMGMRANNPQMELDILPFIIGCIFYIILFSAISVVCLRHHSL